MANNNSIDALDGADGGNSARTRNWAMVQQSRDNQKKLQNNAATVDETGNKQYALVDKSVNTEQQLNPESYDADAGSMSGGYHAGSTISSSQRSDTGTDGGGGGGGNNPNSRSKGDSIKLEYDSLPKGSVKKNIISLYD